MALKINRTTRRVIKGIGIALLIILVAIMLKILVWENNYYKTKTGEERAMADVPITQIISALNPSETEPTAEDIAKYQVEKNTPRYLDIERLNIHARVIKTEVDTNGILATPDNIYDVNWHSGSSAPGEGGYIIISGIHSGKTKTGTFANLDSMEKGDEISIENGDGTKFKYEVKEINVISDQEDSDENLLKMQTKLNDEETLSLITVKTRQNSREFESLVMLRATIKK